MKKLLSYLSPYKKECVISPLFKLLEAVFDLLVPLVVKQIIDVGIANRDKPYIVWMCVILVGFAIVGLSCSLIAQYFAARAAVGFSTQIRRDLFSHIQKLSYAETDRQGTATLITRMTADVNQLQSGVNMTLRLFLRSPIIVLGAMIMAFTVDAVSAWVFAVIIPLLSVVVFTIMLKSVPLYKKVQSNLDRVTAHTRENLTGVRVIRAFRKEAEEQAAFEAINDEHNRMQNFVGKISAMMNPITFVLVNLGLILLLWIGGDRVSLGRMTQGEVVAMTNYMAQILVELVKFANTIILVNKALACGHRVEAVLETPAGMTVTESPDTPADTTNAVRFCGVGLTYQGHAAPALSEIDFCVPRGYTVGIIGSTGSGKSSVVNLIPRFYDATQGSVLVNGKDVRSYPCEELRDRIAMVPQKAVLFRGTVRSNLLWGDQNASDEALWAALEAAQAKEFILEKGGLDAVVEQGGRNFSGGQRQRLTIARALVRKAEILILDDSSSALDYATDAALRHAIAKLPEHPTTFIISQRTASIRNADMIIVLENGVTAGIGKHDELLKTCEVYREIYESQFQKGGEST